MASRANYARSLPPGTADPFCPRTVTFPSFVGKPCKVRRPAACPPSPVLPKMACLLTGVSRAAPLPPSPQVYWPGNSQWFKAVVSGYTDSRLHVTYDDDGVVEALVPELERMWVCTRVVWARLRGTNWWPAMVRDAWACRRRRLSARSHTRAA